MYSISKFKNPATLNRKLENGFYQHNQSPDIKRTHLFHGRYENIYIDTNLIPEIKVLLDEAALLAEKLLDVEHIQIGFWFNHMPPGAVTIAHSHDDDDELLSAVYYVTVPENSGNLLIHEKNDPVEIIPEEGMFVFFKPDVVHEVLENKSQQDRLSIGMNFGVKSIKPID